MTNTVQIPVALGGTNVPYNDGTGAYGMQSNNGYGHTTLLVPMLSEVIAACDVAVDAAATAQSAAVLRVANNLSDLANAATARTNLGLGSAAVVGTGTLLQVANNLSDVAAVATARTNLGLAKWALAGAEYTWAGKPSAATAGDGTIIRITDYGVSGVGLLVISNGSVWQPLGRQCLFRTGVASTLTGSTSEAALATIALGAGMPGVNGAIEIDATWSWTNNANSKTPRYRLGGIAGTALLSAANTTTALFRDLRGFRNRGSHSSQVFTISSNNIAPTSVTTGTTITSAIDFSVAQDIVVTGQLGSGADSITLEQLEMWWKP